MINDPLAEDPKNLLNVSSNFKLVTLSAEIGLINTLDFKYLTKERNKAVKLSFNYSGDAFVAVDAAGHVNVLYLTKNKFIPICKSAFPTCVHLEESENGLVFLGLPDRTICVYNLCKKSNIFVK